MRGKRQNMYPQPWRKHMEAYHNFGGGLNTVTSNDNLSTRELTRLENVDLGDRGSLKRRNGFEKMIDVPATGKGQGYFKWHGKNGEEKHVVAINGKLYNEVEEITIDGLEEGFQTERLIEAVQMGEDLVIATGSGLVKYDGTTAKKVVPYEPKPLEFLYIGSNGLAPNPESHIQDGEATSLRIDGGFPDKRYGIVNETTTFKVVVSKPAGMNVQYKYEFRKKGTTAWSVGKDWSVDSTYSLEMTEVGETEFRFTVRNATQTSTTAQFHIPSYKTKETNEEKDINHSTIESCNRIILHWNRLIIYGDSENRQAMYISHLNKYDYFPTVNSLEFKNRKNEPLQSLVQYRDMLIAFTITSIQAVFGKFPQEFVRLTLNTDVGCIAPYSAKVMENHVVFLSHDGVYVLKSVGMSESRANVEKIDQQIQNTMYQDEDAFAVVEDYQYKILFPSRNERFRYYYQLNAWTKDVSERFNFSNTYTDGIVQDSDSGQVYQFKKDVWSDDGYIYVDLIETKYFDFGEPYNPKKLKEIQILMRHHRVPVNVEAYVYADAALVLSPDESYATVNEDGEVEWIFKTDPNLKLNSGTVFGQWDLGTSPFGDVDSMVHDLKLAGKCRRTKLVLIHREATPNQLLGLGFQFKVKKP